MVDHPGRQARPGQQERDHLADGQRLATVAPIVRWREPVEAEIGIIAALLFRKQQDETLLVRELRPT